jgi:hypothetical protein
VVSGSTVLEIACGQRINATASHSVRRCLDLCPIRKVPKPDQAENNRADAIGQTGQFQAQALSLQFRKRVRQRSAG